ncbi:MAG: M23 family metallopeptidase [Bacteroides sp.]|nr:M23 family metallopeptidase [Bacteroides sp.]
MAKKEQSRKAFWKDIKFKYKLTIVNENTLEEVAGLRVSKLNGISVLVTLLAILFLIAALIITFTPLRNYLPGYMNSEIRQQVVENALKADSLQRLLERQNLYIMNIQDIFRGNVKPDTIHSIDSLTTARQDTLMERTLREEAFRKQYEENEKYNLTNMAARSDAHDMIFYRPANGMVARSFDSEKSHLGIDIAANPGQSIQATLDGTVILSTYTAENGYVIQVQHNKEFISIYKQCGSLLKHEGETVKGGEAIALAGQAFDESAGPHLHFELWHKGKPLNPEQYIVF